MRGPIVYLHITRVRACTRVVDVIYVFGMESTSKRHCVRVRRRE